MSEEHRDPVELGAPLRARLAALPMAVEPERDLWPDIAARIDRDESMETEVTRVAASQGAEIVSLPNAVQPPRLLLHPGRWSVAAALLITLGMGFWIGRQSDGPTAPTVADSPIESTIEAIPFPSGEYVAMPAQLPRNAMSDAEIALLTVKRGLRAALQGHRDSLSPQTVSAIDHNLETIDRAILELRQAIAANPERRELRRALLAYHENEIALLERVTRAASRL